MRKKNKIQTEQIGKQQMNYQLLVDTAVLAGEIMLLSGSETYRVEDTISRILHTSGLEVCDAFVVTTGMMVTLKDPMVQAITQIRRVGEKNTNLGNVYQVNKISRKYCSKEITLECAYESLQLIREKKRYPNYMIELCTIITTASFTILLGSSVLDCLFAALNGSFLVFSNRLTKKIKINSFVVNMVVTFLMAFSTTIFGTISWLPMNQEVIIAGSIMVLLPGVAITNAIRDTLQGDYMSGGARAIEAFVIAASLAVGIGTGISCANFFIIH